MIISYAETLSVPPWMKAVVFISHQNALYTLLVWHLCVQRLTGRRLQVVLFSEFMSSSQKEQTLLQFYKIFRVLLYYKEHVFE